MPRSTILLCRLQCHLFAIRTAGRKDDLEVEEVDQDDDDDDDDVNYEVYEWAGQSRCCIIFNISIFI